MGSRDSKGVIFLSEICFSLILYQTWKQYLSSLLRTWIEVNKLLCLKNVHMFQTVSFCWEVSLKSVFTLRIKPTVFQLPSPAPMATPLRHWIKTQKPTMGPGSLWVNTLGQRTHFCAQQKDTRALQAPFPTLAAHSWQVHPLSPAVLWMWLQRWTSLGWCEGNVSYIH